MLYAVSYPVRTGTIDPKGMQSALFSLSTFDHDFRTRDSVRKKTIAGDLRVERRRRQDLSSQTASANIIHVAI